MGRPCQPDHTSTILEHFGEPVAADWRCDTCDACDAQAARDARQAAATSAA